ncbi:class I SAM-dependent methyltransferase [Conexibacter arvalis]|uniref:Ubiquinone/menaquinone biosynthesis C-methylase UbiE n=1 Tax=Conexibacter arvalis TaxID=912552 RepID=A0A840IIL8_9ACTN|nr:class I SAM-dependent methyltransferase [Conexibacter arvalis]MBB4663788.1 ubiquinone/menaquinone biosynthesis C-methylase UbiE [Conexibacter arvalis]
MADQTPTQPPQPVSHPLFARFYARVLARNEPAEMRDHRVALLAGLRGRVVEVGAGSGANFAHYPTTVDEVVAVEPEPYLRDEARAAAASAPVPVTVVEGVADALPLEDGSCDAAVACLVLCSVPDQGQALAEMRRVLRRPDGELRFFEHVLAKKPRTARLQRVVDRLFWPRAFGGCHTARDTGAAIAAAGFEIVEQRRVKAPALTPPPVSVQLAGRARLPHDPSAV